MQLALTLAGIIFCGPAIVEPRLKSRTEMDTLIKIDLTVQKVTGDDENNDADDPIHNRSNGVSTI
jgi:hypothetical protein